MIKPDFIEWTPSDDALAHYGKKGMKWGKRNAPGSTAAPSLGRAIALGGYGGFQQKSRFTDAKAHKQRTQAGKLLVGSLITSAAGVTLQTIGGSGKGSAAQGAKLVGKLLTSAGSLGGVAAGAGNINAIITEKAARNNKS